MEITGQRYSLLIKSRVVFVAQVSLGGKKNFRDRKTSLNLASPLHKALGKLFNLSLFISKMGTIAFPLQFCDDESMQTAWYMAHVQ